MFEQLNLPELNELEGKIAQLERERDAKAVEASTLRRAVEDAVVADINAEALAAHKGKRAPKPTEPGLRKELEAAERELAVLGRRVALAQSDRSRYIQENHNALLQGLAEAEAREAAEVAAGANELMVALARYYKIGEDRKAMRPLIPEPEGNQQAQKYTLAFGGTQTMANIFGEGKPRGEIEAVLRYLADLAPEQYDLVADDGELQTEGAA